MTGAMQTARSGHVAVLLPNNNQVLIAGGTLVGMVVSSAELYADWRNGFSARPTGCPRRALAGLALDCRDRYGARRRGRPEDS